MKILSIRLKGYERLSLNSINDITIDFTEKLQLILGTNGSGKSSLMKELSPLPATPDEFTKEGLKLITIEHNNSLYVLKSTFSPVKHSFIKNGIELNDGGTAKIQKELVKQEFRITNEIHDLLVGNTNLTSMSPSDRRYWFNLLSEVDYTYAIKVYKTLIEELRDTNGAIKVLSSRLVQENEKLISAEYELELRNNVLEIKQFLDLLLDNKPNTEKTKDDILTNSLEHDIRSISKEIIDNRKCFMNHERFKSIDDIDESIIFNQSRLNNIKLDIVKDSKEFESLELNKNKLISNKLSSTDEIDTNINKLNSEINSLRNRLKFNFTISDIDLSYNSLLSINDNVITIFDDLKPNVDLKYSRVNYNNITDKLNSNKEYLVKLNNVRDKYLLTKKTQEHYKEHNELECPECKHKWIKDFDIKVYETSLLGIEHTATEIDKVNNDIKSLEDEIIIFKNYFDLYKSFINITKTWPILTPLWDHLIKNNIVIEKPETIKHILYNFKVELEYLKDINILESELKSLLGMKDMVTNDSQLSLDNIKERQNTLDNNIHTNNLQATIVTDTINKLKKYKNISININLLQNNLKDMLTKNNNDMSDLLSVYRKESINILIREVKLELSNIEHTLNSVNLHKGVTLDLIEQIKELENKSTYLKMITKELSPVDGLIAKGMLGFINNFIMQTNSFIKKIWSYPLVINTCNIDDNNELDLDYKFDVIINNKNKISDVSKGSTGMQEIIDLAFRLVAMKYLKLDDYAIYLDEFTSRFDKAHKSQAFYVISNLIVQSNFSQVFIVSHSEDSYNSLTNAEFCVLHDANVVLPTACGYNKHVKIM